MPVQYCGPPQDGGLAVSSIIDRLRRQTKEKRIPVLAFFKGFDALKLKRINKQQFVRGLSSAALQVTPQETAVLVEAFRSPADPNHVEYETFADLLNEVFTMKGLQNMPGNKVQLPLQEGFPERLGWHKEGLSNVERARVKEVLESLATTCASEGIDFNFLLAGYDHHKVGVISRNNFTRAIYPLLRRETPKDALLLAKAYTVKDDGPLLAANAAAAGQAPRARNNSNDSFVAYKVIADHLQNYIESVTDTHSPKGLLHPRLNEAERAKIRAALSRLSSSEALKRDEELVSHVFNSYDYHAYGLLSTHHFRLALGLLWDPPLSREEVTLMSLAYALRDGKQDYRVLLRDLEDVREGRNRDVEQQGEHALAAQLAATADGVEAHVARVVCEQRLALLPRFKDADKAHTGTVTRATFHRILSLALRQSVSDETIDALVARHKSTSSGASEILSPNPAAGVCVDYHSFLSALEKQTRATHPSPSVVDKSHLSNEEQERLKIVLQRISYLISSQRSSLRPTLEDFDRTRSFHISEDQFLRVLTIFQLLSPGDKDAALLIKAYKPGPGLGSKGQLVNYARFMADVDPSAYKLPKAESLSSSAHMACLSQPHPGSHEDITEDTLKVMASRTFLGGKDRPLPVLLKEIRALVLGNRVALDQTVKEQDRLNKGVLTRTQLSRALSRINLRMTDTEIDTLADAYAAQGQVDVLGAKLVSYRPLLTDVEKVFAVRHLEKQPNLPAEKVVSEIDDDVYDRSDLAKDVVAFTPTEEASLHSALHQLSREIYSKRIELLYSFKDQDKQNRGYISSNNFVRVLSSANLVTSQYLAEVSPLLVRKFREVFSTGAVFVNYRAFLDAMRALHEQDLSPKEVKDTATFRFAQRKSGAPPQLHRIPVPDATAWQDVQGLSEEAVLKKIKRMTSTRRLNLAEFLADGDGLHVGEISCPKFRSALTRAGLDLEPCELELLESVFQHAVRKDKLCWKAFYARLQATPLPPEQQLGVCNQADNSPLMQLLRDVRARVAQRRIYMKPYFIAYDKSNSSQITFAQWGSIMATLGFVLSEEQRAMVCKAFAVPGFQGYVNYREFLKRVDP